jgi:hypothetical protein
MHPSGFPLEYNGSTPLPYVLKPFFNPSKGETIQDGYKKYMQLPFFAFAAQQQLGPLDNKGKYPVLFSDEEWNRKRKSIEVSECLSSTSQQPCEPTQCDQTPRSKQTQSEETQCCKKTRGYEETELTTESISGSISTPPPTIQLAREPARPGPSKRSKLARAEAEKKQRQKELEEENERALDEAFRATQAVKQREEEFQDAATKALAFNFRGQGSVLMHNPHYLLPPLSSQPTLEHLSTCIQHRELLVMKVIHHAISVLREYPCQSMVSPDFVPSLQKCIKEKKMCLDPTSGGMDLFFHLDPPTTHLRTLALAKFLHIVRVPLCATLSQRQILHPTIFKSDYPPGYFPHILYNQMSQNFLRSMSLRHCTLGIHSPDILREFGSLPGFSSLVKSFEDLEWWCAEKEFLAHRAVFSAPPGGFVPQSSSQNAEEHRLFSDFITHFILQVNISDRIRLPMSPFQNKSKGAQYQPFASSLIQNMEPWRPHLKTLSELLPTPPQLFSTSLDTTAETSEARLRTPQPGESMIKELLKILFMCCLGAQTELEGHCSYSDMSDYTLIFLMHPKLSKTWNDRFLVAKPSSFPEPPKSASKTAKTLSLDAVWSLVLSLPVEETTTTWNTVSLLYSKCKANGIE